MADTHSFRVCTALLVAAALLQGCRGQCDGHIEELVATTDRQIFQAPDYEKNPFIYCQWKIIAEGGYGSIVHLHFITIDLYDAESSECSGSISVYDGTDTGLRQRIATFCRDKDQQFSSTGRTMYVGFTKFTREMRWKDFTMVYWATRDDSKPAYGRIAGLVAAVLACLAVLVCITVCLCRCYRRSAKGRPSPQVVYTNLAPPSDPALSPSPAHQGLSMITSGRDGAWRPDGVHLTSSTTDHAPWGYFSLVDLPPSYDAVVSNHNGEAGARAEETQPVKLPPYSEVMEMNKATKPT